MMVVRMGLRMQFERTIHKSRLWSGMVTYFGTEVWARAFSEALPQDYEYYLWLNDDTILYPEAVNLLLTTLSNLTQLGHPPGIIVGSTRDPQTGKFTYGGMIRQTWWHPLKFLDEPPSNEPKLCDTITGNCVLIPGSIAQVVGNLDATFIHSFGDVDYGLRARQHGYSLWIAPGYIGTCEANPSLVSSWEDPNLTWKERFKKVNSPKGLPILQWQVFARRHAGWLWPFYWLLPYLRLVLVNLKFKS